MAVTAGGTRLFYICAIEGDRRPSKERKWRNDMWLVLLIAAGLALPISLGILAFRAIPDSSGTTYPGF